MFADRSEPVYQDRDRTVGAVTKAENPYIRVEEMMGLAPLTDDDFD